jgi:hypothetical protein
MHIALSLVSLFVCMAVSMGWNGVMPGFVCVCVYRSVEKDTAKEAARKAHLMQLEDRIAALQARIDVRTRFVFPHSYCCCMFFIVKTSSFDVLIRSRVMNASILTLV